MNTETNFYESSLDLIRGVSKEIADSLEKELSSQRSKLKMIASENYCSGAVRACTSSIIMDKYAEGYVDDVEGKAVGHRYYSGCKNIDEIEHIGAKWACELFGSEYAYLQPHSGSNANLIAYWAILMAKVIEPYIRKLNEVSKESTTKEEKTVKDLTREEWNEIRKLCKDQRLLGLSLDSGGHLTHGDRTNISSQIFDCYSYGVDPNTGLIDYNEVERLAMEVKPLILLAGFSAYPRNLNFKRFREIADKCGAVLMVDFSHPMGLLAGKVLEGEYDPVPYADIVTSTSHKTMRGPRSAFILSKAWLKPYLEKGCPLVQGGELPNMVTAKAICFKEAMTPEFQDYAHQIVKNSKVLAERLMANGIRVVTGGTDNHIVLIDVSPLGLTGRQAEQILEDCGIVTNRNSLPNDPNGAWYTSGIRLGTPALTTCGMKEKEMEYIADHISFILHNAKPSITKKGVPSKAKATIREDMKEEMLKDIGMLLQEFKPYGGIEI